MTNQGDELSKDSANDQIKRHENARQLTEDAMEAYVKGDQQRGNDLVDEAKRTDSSAIEEVLQDLDEDAGSDHSISRDNH